MAQEGEGRWTKPPMVSWYDPGQLANTGVQVILSTLLGSMIDARRFAAVEGKDQDCIVDYTDKQEIWFDYMADTGDGWNATYTMAYLLSSPRITLEPGKELQRADFAILGGDEVYPVASRNNYAMRLVWPFNEAARNLGQSGNKEHLRDIYCIPGNHDWYDSLASFTRRFCSGRRIGSFQTRQIRSYFVLKLPHNWEIWAADIQLGHDIDVHQFKFFREHGKSLSPNHRVLVALAEPDWLYGQRSGENLHFNIERLERAVEGSGAKVRLEVAGDIHNYQRYEGVRDPDPDKGDRPQGARRRYPPYEQTKLVSGGGGAFLHPTHTFSRESAAGGGFACKNRYPGARRSAWLSCGNLFFALKNWKMAGLLGLTYLLMFWNVSSDVDLLSFPIAYPGSFVLVLALLASLCAFADLKGVGRLVWGLAHGAAHVTTAALSWHWAYRLVPAHSLSYPGLEIYMPRAVVFLLGALLGGTLFGLYLFLSVNVFRVHENEAFSSLRIDNYKHFLRCHLTADGLKIYVIGVDKVASDKNFHPVTTHLIEVLDIR